MNTTISKDGTPIAFDTSGEESPLLVVGGALKIAMRAATLSGLLAPSFTVMAVAAGVQIATGAGAALRAIVVGVVLSSMSRTNEAGSDRREGSRSGRRLARPCSSGWGGSRWAGCPRTSRSRGSSHRPGRSPGLRHDPARGDRASVDNGRSRTAGRGLRPVRGRRPGRLHDRRGTRDRRRRGPRSQFAAIATIAVFVCSGSASPGSKIVGVAVIAAGVAGLTALQA